MKGMMPQKRRRGRPRRKWLQDVIDLLGVTGSEAGHLAQDRQALRTAVIEAKFHKGQATTN